MNSTDAPAMQNASAMQTSISSRSKSTSGSGFRTMTSYFQLLQPDRQLADALAGGVEEGVADGSVGADIAELAEALDPGRIDLVVLLGEHDHLDAGRVGIHGHQVIGEIVVDVTRIAFVELGCLVQRRRHAPDQSAHQLAACGARVHDAAGGEDAEQARHADLMGEAVDADLDEFGTESIGDAVLELGTADHAHLPLVHGAEGVDWRTIRLPFAVL